MKIEMTRDGMPRKVTFIWTLWDFILNVGRERFGQFPDLDDMVDGVIC